MKPEKIKMDYIYGLPSQKAKSEPEYLQYSEEDKSYSENKKADQSPLSENGYHDNEKDSKDKKKHENINASVPIIIPDVSFSNDDNQPSNDKFYGLVYTGDNYIEFE